MAAIAQPRVVPTVFVNQSDSWAPRQVKIHRCDSSIPAERTAPAPATAHHRQEGHKPSTRQPNGTNSRTLSAVSTRLRWRGVGFRLEPPDWLARSTWVAVRSTAVDGVDEGPRVTTTTPTRYTTRRIANGRRMTGGYDGRGRIQRPSCSDAPALSELVACPGPGRTRRQMPLGVSGKMSAVRFGIVDGEPGIFPDPIARLLRLFGRPFSRDRRKCDVQPAEQEQRHDKERGEGGA